MKLSTHVQAWTTAAEIWLGEHTQDMTRDDVRTGRDAWEIAHRCGIVNEAYAIGRDVVDAHIVSALRVIFPRAVFADKYRY